MSRSFEDDNLFRKFRDLVPEDLDDDALRILIVDNNRDDQQIIDAIANLWNGQPRLTSSWESASKVKKSSTDNSGITQKKSSSSRAVPKGSNNNTKIDKPSRKLQIENSSKHNTLLHTRRIESKFASIPICVGTNDAGSGSNGKPAWTQNLVAKLKHKSSLDAALISNPDSVSSDVEITTIGNEIASTFVVSDSSTMLSPDNSNLPSSLSLESDVYLDDDRVNSELLKAEKAITSEILQPTSEESSSSCNPIIEDKHSASINMKDVLTIPVEGSPAEDSNNLMLSFQQIDLSTLQNCDGASAVPIPSDDDKETVEHKNFLNLGKWESTSMIESDAFQFGSFGDESQSSIWNTSASTVNDNQNSSSNDSITNSSSQPWSSGGTVPTNHNSVDVVPPRLSSLFPVHSISQNGNKIEQVSTRFESKLMPPPPGLEPSNIQIQHIGTTSFNPSQQVNVSPQVSMNQVSNRPQPAHQSQFHQQQHYPQNAQTAASNGRGPTDSTASYTHYTSSPNSQSSLGTSSVAAAQIVSQPLPVVTPSPNTPNQSQPLQQQQQTPQPFAPPPGIAAQYGFYPAHYYPNQAYYYNQANVAAAANYYGQSRNIYSNPRSGYQSDPYSSQASMYPDLYANNQFGDTAPSYGNVPLHSAASLSQSNQQGLTSASGPNTSNFKQKSASLSSSQLVNGHAAQQQPLSDLQPNYPYGYAPRGAEQNAAWPYQNPAQGGWGNMMFLPNNIQQGAVATTSAQTGQNIVPREQRNSGVVPVQSSYAVPSAIPNRAPTAGSPPSW